jgi:hypothetical protein
MTGRDADDEVAGRDVRLEGAQLQRRGPPRGHVTHDLLDCAQVELHHARPAAMKMV